MHQGKFIAIEGCEGVGKSTQIRLLKEYFDNNNIKATFTREPGGTDIAEAVRGVLLSEKYQISPIVEAYLFATARADHVNRVIKPALERGEIVVCDRFIGSSLAYQGKARGLGIEKVKEINKNAVEGCLPDVTIFLNMNPDNSWRKQKGVEIKDDRMEKESAEFHGNVYRGFLELLQTDKSFVSVIPKEDKSETNASIIRELKNRGIID